MPIKKPNKSAKSKETNIKKKTKGSGRKPKRSHSIDSTCCLKTEKHYRLNLGDIPFVVGKVGFISIMFKLGWATLEKCALKVEFVCVNDYESYESHSYVS